MRTARRAFILAIDAGQTNVGFYDAARRQIQALAIAVQLHPIPAGPPRGPENVVIVFRGGLDQAFRFVNCTETSILSEGASCFPKDDPSGTFDSLPKGS